LIGFYNRDEKCLLRGTDWVFKYSGLRFVFKRLNGVGTLAKLLRYAIYDWNSGTCHGADNRGDCWSGDQV